LYPDAVCQFMRPLAVITWMWRSRWLGALAAVSRGTALARGGTMTAASG